MWRRLLLVKAYDRVRYRSYQERALPTELCGQYARNYILSQYG